MQSQQEAVLEDFMQRSFGAPFLYLPQKFRKASGHREPADLLWTDSGLAVLFYMNESRASLARQVEHNLVQANGYLRLWSTGKPVYALRGTNRFGDTCYLPHTAVQQLITFLVVSSECNVHYAACSAYKTPRAVIVIPEILLRWISDYGGTVADLLSIVTLALHRSAVLDPAFDLTELRHLVDAYASQQTASDRLRSKNSTLSDYESALVAHYLGWMKVPSDAAKAFKTTETRAEAARVFGSLSFLDFCDLARMAQDAISSLERGSDRPEIVTKVGTACNLIVMTWPENLGADAAQTMVTAFEAAGGTTPTLGFAYRKIFGNVPLTPAVIHVGHGDWGARVRTLATQLVSQGPTAGGAAS